MYNGKKLLGLVVGVIDQKTIKVEIETTKQHPLYRKVIKVHKKILCHNDKFNIQLNDKVEVVESRKFSKLKSWLVVEKI